MSPKRLHEDNDTDDDVEFMGSSIGGGKRHKANQEAALPEGGTSIPISTPAQSTVNEGTFLSKAHNQLTTEMMREVMTTGKSTGTGIPANTSAATTNVVYVCLLARLIKAMEASSEQGIVYAEILNRKYP